MQLPERGNRAVTCSRRDDAAEPSPRDATGTPSGQWFCTGEDGLEFRRLASTIGIVTQTTRYPLEQANQALSDLRAGRFEGAAVLVP